MVAVTPASHYITTASHHHPHYQIRSSMYIRGLIPRNVAELAEAVPIVQRCAPCDHATSSSGVEHRIYILALGYKTFCMVNQTEHGILAAQRN